MGLGLGLGLGCVFCMGVYRSIEAHLYRSRVGCCARMEFFSMRIGRWVGGEGEGDCGVHEADRDKAGEIWSLGG